MSTLIDEAQAARNAQGLGWEDRLRRLYGAARRRTLQALIAVVVVYLALFQTPLLWWVASPLKLSAPPSPSDAIVVFAGGVGESGKAAGGFQERVTQAISLYRTSMAPTLVFSSGFVFTLREAEVMKAVAVANGIPPEAIILEEQAANTYQNVEFTRRILNQRHLKRILLVSSPYHMRRAMLTWRKVAPEIAVVPTPALESQFYSHEWGASLEQIRGIAHEYAALVAYWWRGWI
jgi:uncharacterized SAM-binding protein YcdF (DUF218 family)